MFKEYEVVTKLRCIQTCLARNEQEARDKPRLFFSMKCLLEPLDCEMEVREIKPKKKCTKRK